MPAPVADQKNGLILFTTLLVAALVITPQGREMAGVVFFAAPLLIAGIAVATLVLGRVGLVLSLLLAAFALLAACFKIVFP